MYYQKNRLRARTTNNDPSLTDQSQARGTDINVIVGAFAITGRVPAPPVPPMSGDFTNLPTDLREMIETSRTLKNRRRDLPPQLREMPIEELLALTPDKLTNILTPPKQEPKPSTSTTTTGS